MPERRRLHNRWEFIPVQVHSRLRWNELPIAPPTAPATPFATFAVFDINSAYYQLDYGIGDR
eukprot:COSAG02_NODE_48646_length_332_cov_0.854077_1_plen_61_part_10